MELRSAEIRSHIVIRRTSRVYSLCVFRILQHRHHGRDIMMYTSSPPSSFTVVPTAPNQSLSHVVFKSALHVVFESSSHVVFKSSSHVYSNPRHMLYYNPSLTISTRNPSWRGTDTIFLPSISATSHRPESQIQQSGPARTFEEWPSPSPQEQSSWQWQIFFITAVVVYPLLGQGSGGVRWCYICVCCESGLYVLMTGPGICILC